MTPPHPEPAAGTSNHLADATVHGPVVQAGTIRDVHLSVYEAMLTPPTPRQLLPVPAVWTDRTSDLDQLTTAANGLPADSARIIAISGPSGVGKTALANRFLYGLRDRFPGGALYADLRGYAPGGPASTPEILARFLRSVRPGVQTGAVDELGAWWRTATDDPARPVCVLLDNAVDANQVRALLPGGPGHVVVTTSRSVLGHLASHGARFHQVQPLTDEASREYLGRCLGPDRVTREIRSAARIVELSAGLPMALAVFVGGLASRADQSLADATTDLMRTHAVVRLAHPVLTPQEVAVTTALNDRYQQLPAPAARVYRRLGGLFTVDADTALAAAVSGLTLPAARNALDVLHTAGLIEAAQSEDHVVRGPVWRFHDSAREHAAAVFAREEPADGQVLRMALDHFLDTMTRAERLLTPTHRRLPRDIRYRPAEPVEFASASDALAWLESQRDNVRAGILAARDAGIDSSGWQLPHALWPLLRTHHDYALWDETHAIALRAARNCRDIAGPAPELEILGTWAVGMRGAGRHADAMEAFEQVLVLARSSSDERAEAQALHEIGATHLAAGRATDAEPFLLRGRQRRTTLARLAADGGDAEDHKTFRRAVAITDVCLGQVQLLLGRPSDGISTFSSARATLLSLNDPIDAARAVAWLGRAHTLDGDPSKGEEFGEKAVAEFDRASSPRWRARSREMLGQTLQACGRRNDAEALYEEAVALYTPISPPDTDRVQQRLRTLDS
ncbi:tetratricopeptide repeat protein [Streptomyces turgidiscabies]|uniref:tetratricopeptide repeat protein n=1 Tax=Streptomyces turgidiscabies TaxID=85558 RepID=UPI0038F7B4ED